MKPVQDMMLAHIQDLARPNDFFFSDNCCKEPLKRLWTFR
jgi:hypothetical protein